MSQPRRNIKPLRRWPVVPPVHNDEDPASIIVRLAKHHFITAHDLFHAYFGSTASMLPDVGNHDNILKLVDMVAGYGIDFLNSVSWTRSPPKLVHFRGRALPSHWIGEQRRVAPGVLAKDGDHPYVRLAWRFPAIAFDLASQELLINHCPSCGKQLSWYQIQSVYRCQSCQFDLRNCTPVVAPQEFVEATRQLAGSIGLLPGKPLKLAYPFQTNDLPTTMLVLEWCAHFDGLMRLDHTSQTVVNASRGLRVAETWPASLELAVDLLFRQDRSEKFEFSVLQPALKSLPTSEMRIEAMQQLAQIMLRPEFRERERPPDYSRPRWKYFDAT